MVIAGDELDDCSEQVQRNGDDCEARLCVVIVSGIGLISIAEACCPYIGKKSDGAVSI